jgi:hypothetical protein
LASDAGVFGGSTGLTILLLLALIVWRLFIPNWQRFLKRLSQGCGSLFIFMALSRMCNYEKSVAGLPAPFIVLFL